MKRSSSIMLAASLAASVLAAPVVAFAAGDGPLVDGEVKELRPNGELTIKHGPLPNLDMPGMTMVFKLSDPAMGEGLKVGDKIKMQVEDVDGKLTIMELEK